MLRILRALACLLSLTPALPAQARPAAISAGEPVKVTLGNSAVALFGPWRFHTGDNPAWAQSAFDDAGWNAVSLRSPDAPPDAGLGPVGSVPGWTARGYPGYSGFAWYRLRVDLQGPPRSVSLEMPQDVDDAYEVFVNGQEIGSFGKFGSHGVTAYAAQPRGFPLPKGVQSGPMVIAIRMWMDSSSRFETPDAGGLHAPPVLGLSHAIAADVRLDWDNVGHNIGSGFLEALVLLLALGVSLTLYWLHREETSYLWLGFVSLVTLLANLILQFSNFTTLIPQTVGVLLRDVLLAPLRIALWVLFWASWFHLAPLTWLRRCVWAFVAVLAVGTLMLRPPLHGQVVPLHAAVYLRPLLLWTKLAMAGLLLVVTILGIRKDKIEGWLALPAILLAVAANFQMELRLLHVRIFYSVLGFRVSLGQISTIVSVSLAILMLSRRFLHSQRRKARWELEVGQAQELQKLIIPRTLPQVPGLSIEGEYRPSLEVGGDFFQIIPNRDNGSVLIAVGDVTGKGLRAGMLVALIVGAIDTAAKEDNDPAHLLSILNSRLCERGYATATCMLMRITADGLVTIANAGHLPPYLNGAELEMEGALPVGTLPDLDYSTIELRLNEGDTLMLMTDGIVEAQDHQGTLFGFDRISGMIASGASAHEIANAAQVFGQEDDILVLRVERKPVGSALTSAAA